MMRMVIFCFGVMGLLFMNACTPTWNHDSGAQRLSASFAYAPPSDSETGSDAIGRAIYSHPVSFIVPAGWHWFERGDDLIVTKDGVFLQHIFIERIHVTQVKQKVLGAFPLAAFSSKQWPTRTVENMKKRFAPGMMPADAASVLIESRRNDPKVSDLVVRKVVTRMVAGRQAFRAVFDFRLKDAGPNPSPVYRSVYCGFMLDEWFYGISYTATLRYYFEKDADTFEAFLDSIRLMEK